MGLVVLLAPIRGLQGLWPPRPSRTAWIKCTNSLKDTSRQNLRPEQGRNPEWCVRGEEQDSAVQGVPKGLTLEPPPHAVRQSCPLWAPCAKERTHRKHRHSAEGSREPKTAQQCSRCSESNPKHLIWKEPGNYDELSRKRQ